MEGPIKNSEENFNPSRRNFLAKVGLGVGAAIVARPALAKETVPVVEKVSPPDIDMPQAPAGLMESAEEAWTKLANETIAEMTPIVHDPSLCANTQKFSIEVSKVLDRFYNASADLTNNGKRTHAIDAYAVHYLLMMKPEAGVMNVFQQSWEYMSKMLIEISLAQPPEDSTPLLEYEVGYPKT